MRRIALLVLVAAVTAELLAPEMLESGSGEEMEASAMEVSTTTRDPVRKWNGLDLASPFESKVNPCEEEEEVVLDEPCQPCPHGWHHYKESCYLIKKRYATMEMADKICQEYESTLFVADSKEELDHISELMITGKTWLGIFKKDEEMSSWQAGCGMDIEELPWLLKYEHHGWTEHSRCAAMMNKDDQHYSHYYPCERDNHLILCERNATLYV